MSATPVVDQGSPPSEQQFHAAVIAGLRGMRRNFPTDKAFATALGLTTKGLAKIYNGGLTCPKRMFDALFHDDSVLDAVAALYGRKLVPNDHGAEESAAPPLVAALHEVIDAERDGVKKDSEILKMDPALAKAEKTIGGLRERARRIRAAQERASELVA